MLSGKSKQLKNYDLAEGQILPIELASVMPNYTTAIKITVEQSESLIRSIKLYFHQLCQKRRQLHRDLRWQIPSVA